MGGVVIASGAKAGIYEKELKRRWEKIPENLREGTLHKKFPEMANVIERWMRAIPPKQREARAYGLSTRGNGHWEIKVQCGPRSITFKDGEVIRCS